MQSDHITLNPRQPAILPAVFAMLLVTLGCGGPKRVVAPELDAKGAAVKAMELYDSNTDGQLDDKELKACMALQTAINEIDTDKDGQISEAEIEARMEYIIQGRVGRMSLACLVKKGNSPVRGATVTFVPEPFMANMIESASGVTSDSGMANINIEDELGGLQPGFYKVEISKLSSGGKETINKRNNTETVLGQEVTSGSIQLSQGLIFQL